MKIQNLLPTISYFGYEAHGIYLNPQEISRELPVALASNDWLRADVQASRVRLLCDAHDRSVMKALGIELPNADKAQEVLKTAVKPAPAVRLQPEATVNVMRVELEAYVNGMATLNDKVKYLEDLILKGRPQARGLAEALLAPLKALQINDPTHIDKPEAPIDQEPQEPQADIKSGEPMINIGAPLIAGDRDLVPRVPQAPRSKALANMSKLEMLSYATSIGCAANPMTAHKDLKTMVTAKETELGYEAKK